MTPHVPCYEIHDLLHDHHRTMVALGLSEEIQWLLAALLRVVANRLHRIEYLAPVSGRVSVSLGHLHLAPELKDIRQTRTFA